MKSITQKSKKPILIITVVLLVVVLFGVYWAFARSEEPTTQNTETTTDSSQLDEDADRADNATDENMDQADSSPDKSVDDDEKTYVSSPNIDVPVDEPFPIETPQYRIEQLTSSSYRITLYPLANTSDPNGYDQELSDYKAKSLDYLRERYGSAVDTYNISWTPERANSL